MTLMTQWNLISGGLKGMEFRILVTYQQPVGYINSPNPRKSYKKEEIGVVLYQLSLIIEMVGRIWRWGYRGISLFFFHKAFFLQLILIPEYSLVTILPSVLHVLKHLEASQTKRRDNICSNEGLVNSPFWGLQFTNLMVQTWKYSSMNSAVEKWEKLSFWTIFWFHSSQIRDNKIFHFY